MERGQGKTKEQLINEMEEMRQRIAELEALEDERKIRCGGGNQWLRFTAWLRSL